MADAGKLVVQLTTTDDPELLHEQIQRLATKFDVNCEIETKHLVRKSIDLTTGGIVALAFGFGTVLIPFLTELLKLRGSDLKTDGGTTISQSNITINNVTVNLNQESIETLQKNGKDQLPPELLNMLLTNLEPSDSFDESDLD